MNEHTLSYYEDQRPESLISAFQLGDVKGEMKNNNCFYLTQLDENTPQVEFCSEDQE